MHFTGEYRGAAHSKSNLKYSIPKKIPIAFHNGSNYDCHKRVSRRISSYDCDKNKELPCLQYWDVNNLYG